MKKILLQLAVVAVCCGCGQEAAKVQEQEPAAEPQKIENPMVDEVSWAATPVKDQARTGTCWAYGGVSMLESEVMRRGGEELNLSEMWIARNAWKEKAVKYVRLNGRMNLWQGGELHDVLYIVDRYGIVPQEVYEGNSSDGQYDHRELCNAMVDCAKKIVEEKAYKNDGWQDEFDKILDEYLGVRPETFVVDGVEYTPKSYAEKLGLSGDDFVYLTSFAHHPYYEEFSIEIPDNWLGEKAINLPLDELLATMYSAVEKGYTIGLGSDISEESYSGGVCVLPTDESYEKGTIPAEEIVVDEALRLKWFDDRTTVDDHIMHIVGISCDPQGNRYFKVKDSGGVSRNFDGYCYISESFMRGKVIEIAVNRAAVDPELLARCK